MAEIEVLRGGRIADAGVTNGVADLTGAILDSQAATKTEPLSNFRCCHVVRSTVQNRLYDDFAVGPYSVRYSTSDLQHVVV